MQALPVRYAQAIRQFVATFRPEHIHIVVKMSPRQYAHTRSCHHNVLRHNEPTFRTMLTRAELRDFKRILRSKHGNEITVRHRWRTDHQRIFVLYSLDAFRDSDLRTELEQELYYMLFDKCLRSHKPLLAPSISRC